MKKRFLPISLLLTIILLAQTSFVVNANSDSGKYTPRTAEQATAQSFMKSIRANQETGLIDPAWLVATENSQSRNSEGLNWSSLGPDNYGSLTRGIVYDKTDATNSTIYIGTMGGGVFQSTNGGITWKTLNNNMMVSCMAQTEDGSIYVGTGDGRGAHSYNGLSYLNYETSFIGSGLYEVKSNTVVAGTEDWEYVNDIATNGNTVYAATNEGLYKYAENTLTALVDTTDVYGVEVTPNGTVLAVVGNEVCIFRDGECEILTNDEANKLPKSDIYKTIAVSPTDDNYMYVSYMSKNLSGTGNIYMTSDNGKTWQVAYTSTEMYSIYGSRGAYDNAIVVYPNNPRKLLIGGLNLWVMRDEFGDGIFRMECISDGSGFQIAQSGGAFYYNYKYVHTGIQSIAFNPGNENEFFVGTEGGVFKGTYSSNGYLYEGVNRYFETEENHTSVARMFSVAFSGENNLTLGGSLDHGTIKVLGETDLNSVTTGTAIFPNDIATTDAAATYGAFEFTKAGGPCAISTIDPNIMFVTATGKYSVGTPVLRTQSAGADYDKENFSYSATENKAFVTNPNAFKTPIVLFENYNDTKSADSVKYYAKRDFSNGEVITDVRSNNCTYPFEYTLTEDLAQGDSIMIKDIISSTLLIATEGKIVMTRDALKFNKKIDWWTIATFTGIPNALAISADGDVAYIGTVKGNLYRLSGISDAVTKDLATVDTVSVITKVEIDPATFNSQAITSIAIDPENSDNIIVTLGNYGNADYVFYSTNGGQSFTSKQGNLPAMPVYSSIIEKTTGKVILGTENGIYTSDNMSTWTQDAVIANIPVMDIKQQILANHDNKYIHLVDEVGDVVTTEYPGIFNEGVIYIATYGRGLYKCDTYKVENSEINVEENIVANTTDMSIYPNPIVSDATISFSIEKSAQVSYQIYDLSGRMMMNKVLGNFGQGSHQANFNVENLTSGAYIIRVQAGEKVETAKILVY